MRITFLDEATVNLNGDIDYGSFQQFDEFKTFPNTGPEDVIARLADAECVMTNKVPITKEVIASTRLRHIAVVATGYNNIDLEAAHKAGVTVSNVPGYASASVPQHIFALILNLVTSVHKYNRDVHAGDWEEEDMFTLLTYRTNELAGKTIGIIGFGSIGRQVAKIAEAFGMRVLMNRKSGEPLDGYACSSLDKIYSKSDVVSLSLPLTDDNRYMINKDVFVKMKSSAILINTARGPLVNQEDLAEALMNGTIAGAGIDVLDEEPPKDGNPLLNNRLNCIITPHSAWSTMEARQRLMDEVAANIHAAARGEERNIVS
jgi:glycerate dehydrogenase